MKPTTSDYSEFISEEAPKNEALARLATLVAEARAKEDELETIAKNLKTAQEELRSLIAFQIPTLMEELGLKEMSNSDGLKIEIKEDVSASIPEAFRPQAFKWLDDNNHGGMIKRDIIVSFNRDQQALADAAMEEISKKFAAVTQKSSVHPSTLKAFVKGQLDEGRDIPLDMFGVFRQKVAKFSETGKKK